MSDIKIVIGAEIKELEQKLAVAKAKLVSFGQEGPRAMQPLQEKLKGLTFPVEKVDKFKDAFKNLATGLIGPTIAIAGLSDTFEDVFTSGAVEWLQIVAKDFITVGDSAEQSAKKIKAYSDIVNNVTESVAKETTQTIGLLSVLNNETETRGRKLEAIKELQKIQPEIFKGLKLEGEAVIGLDEAYKAYLVNLKNVIAAKIIQAQIEAKVTELLTIQGAANGKDQQAQLDRLKNLISTNSTLAEIKKNLQDTKLGGNFLTDKQSSQRVNELENSIKGLFERLTEFSNQIKVKEIKVKPSKIKIEKPDKIEIVDLSSTIQGLESGFDKTPLSLGTGSTIEPNIIVKPKIEFIVDPEQEKKVFDGLNKLFAAERLAAFQKTATDAISATISNIMNDSVSTIADSVADALSGGQDVVPRLFDNIIKGIGGQVKELGKFLVKTGIEMLAAQKAVKALGLSPQGAIIAGFALQVLGGLLTAAAQKKSNSIGFATGVRDFQGGGIVTVGERGPERIFLPAHSTVQPNNEMQAFGGGSQVFIPAVTLSGSDLVIAFNRASNQMGRNN